MSAKGKPPSTLTERQQKWMASVKASLERDTGKTIEQWVKIAKTCPETTPKKRVDWLREKYGLGVNRAVQVLSAAFPEGPGWDEPDALLDQLWKEPEGRAIYEAVAKLVRKAFPEAVIGPRKTFVSFSRTGAIRSDPAGQGRQGCARLAAGRVRKQASRTREETSVVGASRIHGRAGAGEKMWMRKSGAC